MDTICIYHKSCLDGFAAAWAVNRALCENNASANVEFVAGAYGEDPPDVTDKAVLMVDFSYKRPVIEVMMRYAMSILIIDHHKTAEEDLSFLPEGPTSVMEPSQHQFSKVFDMEQSGAGLTWNFFHPGKPPPKLLQAIEDRDLWRFQYKDSNEAAMAAASYPMVFELWDSLMMESAFPRLVEEGRTIARYRDKTLVDLLVQLEPTRISLGGYVGKIVNLPYVFASEAGQILGEGMPFGGTYAVVGPDRVLVSLRSREEGCDVSEIAKRFGGGGHKHAAGFEIELQTLLALLN